MLLHLLRQDGFNLILIVVTILALCQTMVVHRVWHYGESMGLALTIDRVCTGCILYFTFPGLVIADVLTAFGSTFALGVALLILIPVASIAHIWRAIRARELRKRTNEASAVAALLEDKAGVGDPRREEQLSRAFTVFDRDETGYLAPDELRRLLLATYPSQPPRKVTTAWIVKHSLSNSPLRLSSPLLSDWPSESTCVLAGRGGGAHDRGALLPSRPPHARPVAGGAGGDRRADGEAGCTARPDQERKERDGNGSVCIPAEQAECWVWEV